MSVELHQTVTFVGRSTSWATAPRHFQNWGGSNKSILSTVEGLSHRWAETRLDGRFRNIIFPAISLFFPARGFSWSAVKLLLMLMAAMGKSDKKFGSKLEVRKKLCSETKESGLETKLDTHRSSLSTTAATASNINSSMRPKNLIEIKRFGKAANQTVLRKCARLFSGMRKLWVKVPITKGAPTSSQWLPQRDQPR